MAEAAGAPKGAGWDDNSRIPLGTAEVSPLEPGQRVRDLRQRRRRASPTTWSRRSATRTARCSTRPKPEENRAVSADIARDVTFALSNVVEERHRQHRADPGPPGRRQDRHQRTVEDDIVNSAWFVGYTQQISTAVMYVAGDGGNADLDDYARPGRQHLLRRHLSRADLGRLHGDGHQGPAGQGVRARRRTSTATGAPSRPLRPEPTQTREPSRSRPRPARSRSRSPPRPARSRAGTQRDGDPEADPEARQDATARRADAADDRSRRDTDEVGGAPARGRRRRTARARRGVSRPPSGVAPTQRVTRRR